MARTKWKDIDVSSLQEFNAETHRLTIESIQQAMNELMNTKPFHEITIMDIVKKAGVSRSAFYRNYNSKQEVLQSIVHDSFAAMRRELNTITDPSDMNFWRHVMIGCINQFKRFHSIRNSEAWQGGTLLQCMNEYLEDIYSKNIHDVNVKMMRYWMGGTYNVILGWLDDGMIESPEELADEIMKFISKE
jgi:AcrR family transcriptional regulator